MKNGYTPKQFAYTVAIDQLYSVYNQKGGWLDSASDLTEADKIEVRKQIAKLHKKLAETVNLEINELE